MALKTYASFDGNASAQSSISTGSPASSGAAGNWHPTILTMLGLIVAEIVAVAVLSRHLLR